MKNIYNKTMNYLKEMDKRKKIVAICMLASIIVITLVLILLPSREIKLEDLMNFKQDLGVITKIESTNVSSEYLTSNSNFIITTNKELSVEELTNNIAISPNVEFNIAINEDKTYTLSPRTKLPENTIVSISSVKEGNTLNKWAFQTERKLAITDVYPSNNSTYVSPNTIIEFTFSYNDIEDFNDLIEFSTRGTLTKNGYKWTFTPDKALEYNKTYTITLKKGITNGTKTLDKDYVLKFTTTEAYEENYDTYHLTSVNLDNSVKFTSKEIPVIGLSNNKFFNYEDEDNKFISEDVKVNIYKLDTYLDYIEYSKNYKTIDCTNLPIYNSFNTKTEDHNKGILKINFNDTLPIGYYIGEYIINGEVTLKQLIEVTDIVSYTVTTERDTLVWLMDSNTNKPINNASITYESKNTLTNDEGIAIIKDIKNENDTTNSYVLVNHNDTTSVILTQNFNSQNYYNGFVYTDKKLYQPNDKILVWGVIPKKLFIDGTNKKLILEFDNKEYPVTINDYGVFNTEIAIKNKSVKDYSLELKYDGKYLDSRYIEIAEYQKPKYDYKITTDKDYYEIGEEIKVTVDVKHMSGISVIGKNIVIRYNEETKTCVTDDKGLCNTTFIATSSYSDYSSFSYQDISVYAADSTEYNDAFSKGIKVLINDTFINTNLSYKTKDKYNININVKKIDISNGKNIINIPYNGDIKVDVKERTSQKVLEKRYDPYTKTNIEYYKTSDYEEKTIDTYDFTVKNGVLIIDNFNYQSSETDDTITNYSFEVSLIDGNGNTRKDYLYLSNYWDSYNYDGYNITFSPTTFEYYYNELNIMYLTHKYRDLLEDASINTKLDLNIIDYQNNVVNEDQTKLSFAFKENILDTYFNTSEISFKDNYFPGVNVGGAVYNNGKMYWVTPEYVDYHQEDRLLNINLNTNKDIYVPGEEVTLNISALDINKKGVKTDVLISVVDEAVFKLVDDEIYLDNLYYDKYFPYYQITSYQMLPYGLEGGGMGDASDLERTEFGDTVLFKNVRTDGSGNAKITFKLNDSVTSFRITAIAVNDDLYYGTNTKIINSQLEFFIETGSLTGFKSTDDFVVPTTTISKDKKDINYTYLIDNKETKSNNGTTNNYIYTNFGKMNVGNYHLTINATDNTNKDSIGYDFSIKDNYQTVKIIKKYILSKNYSFDISPNKDKIIVNLYDETLRYYQELLNILNDSYYDRLDQYVGRYMGVIINNNINKETDTYSYTLDSNYYSNDGLKLLPSSTESLALTALTIKYANPIIPEKVIDSTIDTAYANIANEDGDATRIYESLLLLSSVSKPIMPELNVLNSDERNSYQSLLYALSYAFLGDYNKSREIYNKELVVNKKLIGFSKYNKDLTKNNKELITVLVTLIDPNNAKDLIIQIKDSTNEYRNYAIISYLINSMPYLEEDNIVKVNDKEYTLNKLSLLPLEFNIEEIPKIKITSNQRNVLIKSIYEGSVEEISNEQIDYDVETEMKSKLKLDDKVTMDIKVSGLEKNTCGNLYVTIPAALKYYNSEIDSNSGVYLNNRDAINLKYYVCSNKNTSTTFKINFLVSNIGSYTFEPVTYRYKDNYGISDKIDIKVTE